MTTSEVKIPDELDRSAEVVQSNGKSRINGMIQPMLNGEMGNPGCEGSPRNPHHDQGNDAHVSTRTFQ